MNYALSALIPLVVIMLFLQLFLVLLYRHHPEIPSRLSVGARLLQRKVTFGTHITRNCGANVAGRMSVSMVLFLASDWRQFIRAAVQEESSVSTCSTCSAVTSSQRYKCAVCPKISLCRACYRCTIFRLSHISFWSYLTVKSTIFILPILLFLFQINQKGWSVSLISWQINNLMLEMSNVRFL